MSTCQMLGNASDRKHQLTRRNIGPNQVKKTKSKGLLLRFGDTIGFLRLASRLAFALLSFLVNDRLSASMRLCTQSDQHPAPRFRKAVTQPLELEAPAR